MRFTKLAMLILIVGILIGAGGCATIMNGTTDLINISSNPSNAKFSIISVTDSGKQRTTVVTGETPQNVILQRKTSFWGNNYLITFKKEGYINKTISIKKTLSGWAWGNILFGGIIGLTIDGITGAADDLHNVSVRLISDDRWDLMMRERMSEP